MTKEFKINGTIVDDSDAWFYNLFGVENVSPSKINNFLNNSNGEDVKLSINSGGGSVYAGSEIYTALKNYSGGVAAEVTGLCASIASVIMLAADHIAVAPLASIMIHNVWSISQGDYRDMDHEANILKDMSASIASVYAQRMGISVEEAQEAMDETTYYTADQAIIAGLADEKLFEEDEKNDSLQLVASVSPIFSSQKIAGLKEVLASKGGEERSNDQLKEITSKLDTLISLMQNDTQTQSKKVTQSADKPTKNHTIKFFGGMI